MNVSFHYFAVKSIARAAGFDERRAQRIAVFSQYVDDCNTIKYLKCSNIPDWIRAERSFDLIVDSVLGNFNPVMTGFTDALDYAFLALERTQRFTVSPFHFIGRASPYGKLTRTAPAVLGDGSLIDAMLGEARIFYERRHGDDFALMKVGMLLHTFADTYAHEYFSGFLSDVNDVSVSNVVNNADGASIETQAERVREAGAAREPSEKYVLQPAIGHMWAKHTPDLTNVTYNIKLYYRDRFEFHTKNNTETFLRCAESIYEYLRTLDPGGAAEPWNRLSQKLRAGFLFSGEDSEALRRHWNGVFGYDYRYDKKQVNASFLIDKAANRYSDDFYAYHAFADKTLIRLYGTNPRPPIL